MHNRAPIAKTSRVAHQQAYGRQRTSGLLNERHCAQCLIAGLLVSYIPGRSQPRLARPRQANCAAPGTEQRYTSTYRPAQALDGRRRSKECAKRHGVDGRPRDDNKTSDDPPLDDDAVGPPHRALHPRKKQKPPQPEDARRGRCLVTRRRRGPTSKIVLEEESTSTNYVESSSATTSRTARHEMTWPLDMN